MDTGKEKGRIESQGAAVLRESSQGDPTVRRPTGIADILLLREISAATLELGYASILDLGIQLEVDRCRLNPSPDQVTILLVPYFRTSAHSMSPS